MRSDILPVFAAVCLLGVGLPTPVGALDGSCTLTNTKKSKVKFEGPCVVTQDTGVDHADYRVELGNGKSFHFADKGFGYRLEHKGVLYEVAFEDKGDVAVYRWGRWELLVPSEL